MNLVLASPVGNAPVVYEFDTPAVPTFPWYPMYVRYCPFDDSVIAPSSDFEKKLPVTPLFDVVLLGNAAVPSRGPPASPYVSMLTVLTVPSAVPLSLNVPGVAPGVRQPRDDHALCDESADATATGPTTAAATTPSVAAATCAGNEPEP